MRARSFRTVAHKHSGDWGKPLTLPGTDFEMPTVSGCEFARKSAFSAQAKLGSLCEGTGRLPQLADRRRSSPAPYVHEEPFCLPIRGAMRPSGMS
ncbi:hypothetical protein BLAT2472_50009 [Burkholderia latens]